MPKSERDSAEAKIDADKTPKIDGTLKKSTLTTMNVLSPHSESFGNSVSVWHERYPIVNKIEAYLSNSFLLAETDSDYDKTDMFEIMKIVMGDTPCDLLSDKHAFYLYVHTKLIPRKVLTVSENDQERGLGKFYSDDIASISFCGHHLSLNSSIWNNLDRVSGTNPTGVTGSASVTLTR